MTQLKLSKKEAQREPASSLPPWRVLVVDDDEEIHVVTRFALRGFQFSGRGIEVLSAYSAAAAREVLATEGDIAMVLLDVVMETDDAGLRLVRHIREELKNANVRIVLRTGQPGQAPEDEIIVRYDINDYKAKTELTVQKLFTTTVMALRAYDSQANHDLLTGLPNRNLMADRIAQAVGQAHRAGQCIAVLCLDLDRFRFINDSAGHPIGDLLLKAVAGRLSATVRETDTVARPGGDEFALVLSGLAQKEDAAHVARKVLAAFTPPFEVCGEAFRLTASIGVSLYPEDGDSSDALLKHADAARSRAKAEGGNAIHFYAPEMGIQVQERVALEGALHRAMEQQEFELHYQPKIDLRSGRICVVEALIRWNHPQRGLVEPQRFIPLAEETGLIVPIGEWALRAACAQARAWHAAGHAGLTVAVNLSVRQFQQGNLPERVRQVLAESGLTAEHLELELTESLLMENSESVLRALRQLKDIGLTLSLDDFGTGYSSLAYLTRFPIDVVKIDRSFIRDVTTRADDAALTRAIIAMAQSLRMKTVAEGVETEGQLGFLTRNRCDAIQGYYFSRPLPAREMTALLRDGKDIPADRLNRDTAKPTLLLLDDDENILRSLQRLLRRDGYHILSASSAHEALELLAIYPVGVIVSDARMPEVSGVEFLGRVKNLYPDVVRIMLSGYTELQSVTDAINEGAVYKFFTKPWDDAALRQNIADAFRRYEILAKAGSAWKHPGETVEGDDG